MDLWLRVVSLLIKMLGINLQCSLIVVWAFNCWAITPVTSSIAFNNIFNFASASMLYLITSPFSFKALAKYFFFQLVLVFLIMNKRRVLIHTHKLLKVLYLHSGLLFATSYNYFHFIQNNNYVHFVHWNKWMEDKIF